MALSKKDLEEITEKPDQRIIYYYIKINQDGGPIGRDFGGK
jgi:hypothetical protein